MNIYPLFNSPMVLARIKRLMQSMGVLCQGEGHNDWKENEQQIEIYSCGFDHFGNHGDGRPK